ncbi:hypothetical protein JCM10207_005913 [Rhodosporidiobolus poonsookiae]
MPATRRSETAPKRSARVKTLEADKAAKEKQQRDAAERERKAEEAAARKAKAAKSKGKAKRKVATRRAPVKRKAEEEEKEDEPKAKKGRTTAASRKAKGEEAEEEGKEEEEKADDKAVQEGEKDAEADEPKQVEGGKYKIGDVVEDVELKNEDDKAVSLKDLYSESGLVIFSYPSCTTQACNFRDTKSAFAASSYAVYGLSRDKPSAQLSWKSKHELGYSLLCDPDAALLKRLGATEAQKRCHWIIEKGGKLLEAKIGVKPADDAKNALKFVESLSGGGDKKADAEEEEKDDKKEQEAK